MPDGRQCVIKVYKSPQVPHGHRLVVGFETESLVRAIARRIVNQCVLSSNTGGFRTVGLSRVLNSWISRHPLPVANQVFGQSPIRLR